MSNLFWAIVLEADYNLAVEQGLINKKKVDRESYYQMVISSLS